MLEKIKNKLPFEVKKVELLHSGENPSFLMFTENKDFVLKKYRRNRGFKLNVLEEVHLTQRLENLGVLTSHFCPF